MIVKASMEGKFRCKKKVVKRHSGLQVFRSCVVLVCVCACVLVTQSCPIVCKPLGCSLPGSSIHRISQARTLDWVAISFSRGSSQPREWTWVSCTAGRFFTIWATREAWLWWVLFLNQNCPALWETRMLLMMRSKGRNFMSAYETNVQRHSTQNT